MAPASDYGRYSADSLMAAAMSKGLKTLGEGLRAIEDGDSGGDNSTLQEKRRCYRAVAEA